MNKKREAKSVADVTYVTSLIDKYDAIGFARKRATELMKEALTTLKEIRWKGDRDAAGMLSSFPRFAVEREW